MSKKTIRKMILCFLAICILGCLVMFNRIFFKSLLHWNHYDSGEQGDNVISDLQYDRHGYSMIISGQGNMSGYIPASWANSLYSSSSGWRVPIKSVYVEEGVTSISSCLFMGCSQLRIVNIPNSMHRIGIKAFAYCNDLSEINFNGTKAEWRQLIVNSPSWNDESNIHTVICLDGKLID